LKRFLDNVIFLMRGSTSWRTFHATLKRTAPRLNEQAEFEFDDY
jgi:hypothetical protein